MQARSLLNSMGLSADAGVYLGMCPSLSSIEKYLDSHPTDLHFEGGHPYWMTPISDGFLVPVITKAWISRTSKHKAKLSRSKVPSELIKVEQILIVTGSIAMAVPILSPCVRTL